MTAGETTDVVPKLRFPEFQETPAWSIEPLGRLFRERQETGFSELPLLSVTDRDGVIPQEETNRRNTSNSNKAKYLRVVSGDIAYNTMRMWEGRSARVGMEGVVSPAYTVCRPGADTNSYFFAYYFKTDFLIKQFRKYSQGLVKDTLNLKYEAFSRIPVGFPSSNEQQKIADCLGSLDDLITAEDRKLEALRQHKQGLMQQLFPQPGETAPVLGNRSDWKVLDLSEVAFFQEGPGIMAVDFCTDGVPLVRLSGLAGTTVTLDGCDYLNPDKVAKKWAHFRLVVGDLLISTSASFGLVSIVTEVAAGAVFYTGLVRFRSIDKRLSNSYLKAYLESPDFLRQAEAHAVGGGIKHFGPTHLRQMQIQLPALDEQRRIAECLSWVDACIAGQSRKLKNLNRHKQGLLEQLFPTPEEESR